MGRASQQNSAASPDLHLGLELQIAHLERDLQSPVPSDASSAHFQPARAWELQCHDLAIKDGLSMAVEQLKGSEGKLS